MKSLTSRGTLWIFSLLLLTSCALLEAPEEPEAYGPREKLMFGEYDNVWRATQIALQKYPMYINNMDKGILETEVIKGYNIWTPPHKPGLASGGMRYRLSVKVIKGNLKGESAVKVTIIKELEMQTDFFAGVKKLPTDGLEEKSLLYRIERELQIDKALQRAQKKLNR